MPRVITNGTPVKDAYEPPLQAKRETRGGLSSEDFAQILATVKAAIAGIPAPIVNVAPPVVNVPKPEVKINSPVYVQPTEVKVPATTVNVPEGKAPVVNIEPAAVTLQTNRPKEWEFEMFRDELGRLIKIRAKAIT